jgi:N-terminal domain of toast_rack, DUF2154
LGRDIVKINISSFICLLSLVAAVFISLGCIGQQGEQVGPLQSENSSIPLGDAKSVNAQITMGVGKLNLEGGAKDLMDANFLYNLASWKPEVSYAITDGVGDLKVSQPTSGSMSVSGDVRYEWNIRLNSEVPIDLRTMLGAGDGNLKLGGMSLTGLKAQSGAGNVTIDLSGVWKRDLNASVEAGIGNLVLIVPQYTGTMINVSQGLGTVEIGTGLKRQDDAYINDAYGQTATTLRLNVKAGIGDIRLMQSP